MNMNNITGNGNEPEVLTEISDVTFESNRLVLRVSDPIKARKFGLSDDTWRYEFDGGSMYWFKSKDETVPCAWACSCGRGSYTILSNDGSRQVSTVKDEMLKQVVAKGMLEYFGNKKEFTSVAKELGGLYYDSDGSLKQR